MKYSRQREMVLQTVLNNRVHPTAEFVYTHLKPQLPTISLATVYRNLNLLADTGVILRLNIGDGVDRFDGNPVPHHHMYCVACRKVIDIPAQVEARADEEDAAQRGYRVTGYEISFQGLCPDCVAREQISH